MPPARSVAPLVIAAVLAACEAPAPPAPGAIATEPGSGLPSLPLPVPTLDREALLLAVMRAASSEALGEPDTSQRELDGRRFELRMRFGCPGEPASPGGGRQVLFDEAAGVLRVVVAPDITDETEAIGPLLDGRFEDAEGFWIRRPWTLQPGCPRAVKEPANQAPTEGEPEPAHRIGLAQFFTASDARTYRRDRRAFTFTTALAAGEQPSAAGYDLVVGGRLSRLPEGKVIACADQGAAQPPTCIVSAQFERVAVESPDGEQVFAEWSTG